MASKVRIPRVAIHFAALLILLLLTLSCHRPGDGKPVRVNPAFREYVEAFTSGLVSTQATVQVRLNQPFVDSSSVGVPVTTGLISVDPEVPGVLVWSDTRTLEFRPDKPLEPDRLFTAQFFLSRLITVPDSLKTMTFQFRTMKQDFDVRTDHRWAEDPADLSRETILGTLTTADVASDSAVEIVMKATQEGKSLTVSWQHDGAHNTHSFRVEGVTRGRAKSVVKMDFDGKPIGSETTHQLYPEIAPLGVFGFNGCRNLPGDDPCFVLTFTDPLKPGQDPEGMVRIGRMEGVRVAIRNNELLVYPPPQLDNEFSLSVEPFLKNADGKELGQRIDLRLNPSENKPAVRFVGTGAVMPPSAGMLLPFEAVNLRAVDVKVTRIFQNNILQFLQTNDLATSFDLARVGKVVLRKTIPLNGNADYGRWNRYSIDMSTLIKADPGAIYTVTLSFRKEYSTYPCDSGSVSPQRNMVAFGAIDEGDRVQWGYYSDDDDWEAYGGWNNYRWQERNDPCRNSYYYNKSVSRNVFASNLGLIAKGSGREFVVFVTDLVSGKPMKEVRVQLLSYQQQPIASGTTDGDGMVRLSGISAPAFVVAERSGEKGYLRLQDGTAVSLSMFDVGGEPVQKGLKGFIYGDRGVWRPGDSIFLTFMLEDKSKKLPASYPVSLALTDPSGQLATRLVNAAPVNGFYVFRLATAAGAPTGNWLATVRAGGALFTRSLKIETVKPNRLKINLNFGKTELRVNQPSPVTLQAAWLTGALAGSLKAQVGLTLTRTATAFAKYPSYQFENPTATFAAENATVFDGRLNTDGSVVINPVIQVVNVAPGMLNASFETKVFEEGGDFSIDRFTIPYSPYVSYAGLKLPATRGFGETLSTDRDYEVQLANVDADGNPAPAGNLNVEVFKLEWRWWWDNSENNSADFVSTSHLSPVEQATVKTAGGKGMYRFRVLHDDWGRYLLRVTDPRSGHAAAKVVYVDWPDYYRMPGGEKQAAAMLTLTADKPKYAVGDLVKVTIPTTPDGQALLTIENGSTVLQESWTPTKKGTTEITFRATAEMTPNCYAYVTLIQPHAQALNDLPIRLYGVLPVPVENPSTNLKPIVGLKGKLTPMQPATVTVKEASGKPMTYTLAIVDEGLLDLTRFKTPDPWSVFYAREALGVKTWDLYDQVMGAYSGDLQRILSIGGDKDLIRRSSLKANRFKPMVRFFGPFRLKAGETGTTTFTMPEYIGSVRIMAIAGNDGAYGSGELTVPVKKALMVQGTLPRVLGPGETVTMPVSVFAMESSVRNATVTVETNDFFEAEGGKSRAVTFSGIGEKLVTFTLKVREMTGIGRVTIRAASGSERAESTVEIDVRNPGLPVTDVYDKTIPAGGSQIFSFPVRGMKGTNSGVVELSTMPSFNLEKWLSWLIRYPYGCVEQTTSSVFPQLFLSGMAEMGKGAEAATEANIRAGIRQLKNFQLPGGGLAYWPGSPYADDWGTSYAGHFILEAEKKGYTPPPGFLQAWKTFQREKALSWPVNASWSNDELAQAYRLYTLALARAPETGAMNKLAETKGLTPAARWRLAGAYALAGKPEAARALVKGTATSVTSYRELSQTYGSDLRDKAMILEVMTLLNMRTEAAPLARDLAAQLGSDGWYGTQTTAYCLIALSSYYGKESGKGIEATFAVDNGTATNVSTAKSVFVGTFDPKPGARQSVKVVNKGKGNLFARVLVRGIPVAGDSSSASNGLKIAVTYTGTGGGAVNPATQAQGTTFLAEVRVTNTGNRGPVPNLALVQVFPEGWEIGNPRMSEATATLTRASAFSYQDVRDDRVITYFDLGAGETRTFKTLLTATYIGRFRMPPVQCEAMYDNTINARVPGRWVTVVK